MTNTFASGWVAVGARDDRVQHAPLNGPLRSRPAAELLAAVFDRPGWPLLVLRHSTTRREETTPFSRHSDRGRRSWLPAAARDPVPQPALSIAEVHLTQQIPPSRRSIPRHFRLLPRAPPGVRSLGPSPKLIRPSDASGERLLQSLQPCLGMSTTSAATSCTAMISAAGPPTGAMISTVAPPGPIPPPSRTPMASGFGMPAIAIQSFKTAVAYPLTLQTSGGAGIRASGESTWPNLTSSACH